MSGLHAGRVRIEASELSASSVAEQPARVVVSASDLGALSDGQRPMCPARSAALILFSLMLSLLVVLAGGALYATRPAGARIGTLPPALRMGPDAAQRAVGDHSLQLAAPLVRGYARSLLVGESGWLGSAVPWRLLGTGHLLLVTNAHVAGPDGFRGDGHLEVEFASGNSAPVVDIALPVGRNDIDLALVLVSSAGLVAEVDFTLLSAQEEQGWSRLAVGDDVVAVGSSQGFPQTQTFGRISALRTRLPGERPESRWIQFDATVLPGNSGGPLLRRDEESWRWIGIVTARGPRGIGLALHTSELQSIGFRWSMGRGPQLP